MVFHVCVFLFVSIRLCIGQMKPPGCGRPVGDGWHLIRRSANSLIRRWHAATDNMAFTQEYNTDNILNQCVTDAQCAVELTASFSKSAASVLPGYDQVLYASGDCQYWLILNRTVTDIMSSYRGGTQLKGKYDFVRTSMNPQFECTYDVRNINNYVYTIGSSTSYPWIEAPNGQQIFSFYREGSSLGGTLPFIYNNGMNVWIRNAELVNDLKDCYPSKSPTVTPTMQPSVTPTLFPSINPSKMTETPTMIPSITPTKVSINPTETPSQIPTEMPTNMPSINPTETPSKTPTQKPSQIPSKMPSNMPSRNPTYIRGQTSFVSNTPTHSPTYIREQTTPSNNFSDAQSTHILSYFVYIFIAFFVIFLY